MSTVESRLDYLLNFPFGLTINNVWHWSFIIRAVSLYFVVLCEEVDVEDWIDLHQCRESEMVCDGGEFLGDREGAVMLGCQLCSRVMGL